MLALLDLCIQLPRWRAALRPHSFPLSLCTFTPRLAPPVTRHSAPLPHFFPEKGNTFRFLLLNLQIVILRTEMKTETMTYNLLNSISEPEDLRRLDVRQLPEVCKELRQDIIEEVSCNPGHFAASLGTVEPGL